MFKTQLIQKSQTLMKDEMRVPLSKKPGDGMRPAEEGDKKSTVNKNVDKGVPEMVAEHFKHHPNDREKMYEKPEDKKKLDKSTTAGSSSTTGSNMMHAVADGTSQSGSGDIDKASAAMTAMGHPHKQPGTKPLPGGERAFVPFKSKVRKGDEDRDEEEIEHDQDGKKPETKHRAKTEDEEEKEDVEKGFLTHLKGQGRVPEQGSKHYGAYAAGQARHREHTASSSSDLKDYRHDEAMAGMRNMLHKQMVSVAKGLTSLVIKASRGAR